MLKEIFGRIADYLWGRATLENKNEKARENGQKYEPKEIKVGPETYELTDILTNRILYLTQPQDVSGRPAILPDIRIRVFGEDNHPIKGRTVVLELASFSGTDFLKGVLQHISDDNGDVIFSNLKISRSGKYELLAKSDGQYEQSVSFEISPPGLDTNFSPKPFNSPEYWDALARKIAQNKAGDEVNINGEDI